MKRIYVLILICISSATFAQSQGVRVDITPIERFYELMSHIEKQKGSKLVAKRGTVEQLRAAYAENIKDTVRQRLIKSLLETRPYSHQYMDYVRVWKYKNKEAYRVAFNMIGDYCPSMTADMPKSWVRYWNNPNKPDLASIKRAVNSFEVRDSLVHVLLPKDGVNKKLAMVIYYTVDGNRGGYQEDNIMVLDIMFDPIKANSRHENTIAHELHHIYYEDWLNRHITTATADSSFREFQTSFMMEGTAQYMDYPGHPKAIKRLFKNKRLLAELLAEVESGIYMKDDYKLDVKRLWKYLPFAAIGNYSYRPKAHYYLSLNVYKSIEEVGGKEMLDYVIANPKELISTYNGLYDKEKMNFGPFSDSFTEKWRANL